MTTGSLLLVLGPAEDRRSMAPVRPPQDLGTSRGCPASRPNVQTFRQLHFSMSNHLLIYNEQVNYSTGCNHHTECTCRYEICGKTFRPTKQIYLYLYNLYRWRPLKSFIAIKLLSQRATSPRICSHQIEPAEFHLLVELTSHVQSV